MAIVEIGERYGEPAPTAWIIAADGASLVDRIVTTMQPSAEREALIQEVLTLPAATPLPHDLGRGRWLLVYP
jgi:hypothetical protein